MFRHVEAWVFDVDNTLYDPEHGVFDQIDRKMTEFIAAALSLSAEAANDLRKDYYHAHGTTLAGLMAVHGLAPDAYLEAVHDVDLSHMPAAPALGAAIAALPGRKIVHTNGSRAHGARVIAHLGIAGVFDGVYGIEDSDYAPKPAQTAFEQVLRRAEIDPARAAMIEDTARNLAAPHAMGMRTIWKRNADPLARQGSDGAHIDVAIDDLTAFLTAL